MVPDTVVVLKKIGHLFIQGATEYNFFFVLLHTA